MQTKERSEAVELLRRAGDVLEAAGDQTLFPGWEEDDLTDEERGVRTAAEAIRAHGKTCDQGTRVHMRDLGYLVRYIADMLEE